MSSIPIKSVQRIFEILEYFDQQRRPLTAKEVADHFGYPLMSAHALLKSMNHLGYTDFDAPKWAYMPSRKFMDVMDWARDFLDRETNILDFAEALNQETRETVNVSRRNGQTVRILHGLETRQPIGVSVQMGTEMSATRSLTGLTALACLAPAELETFLRRLKKTAPKEAKAFDRKLCNTIREELKDTGSALRCDVFIEGIGALCTPVLAQTTGETLIVGIVGPSDRILAAGADHRKALKRMIGHFKIEASVPMGGS